MDRGGERAAAIYTLIETAKLNGVDPQACSRTFSAGSPTTPQAASPTSCPGIGNQPPPRQQRRKPPISAAPAGWLQHTQRLEEINVSADIAESQALYRYDAQPSGVKWVDGLRSSVRPMITYAFFLLFAAVKGSGLYLLIAVKGLALAQALPQIWDEETAALFAAVVSFWFGARSLAKARGDR